MVIIRLTAIVFTFVLVACASQKPSGSSQVKGSQGSKYSEDLSIWRPKVDAKMDTSKSTGPKFDRKNTAYVNPTYTINDRLNATLDSIDRIYLTRRFVEGYTIQIYSGQNREAALSSKKELTAIMPEIPAEVFYNQPNFRVKVGKYFNRMDAQKDFVALKKYFPNAIVIPEKITIN